nr:8-hydroxygeraniol dehydrogenase-like [Ipomoea batatas]
MAAKSYEEEHPVKVFGWAATDTSGHLSPFKFSRRETGEKDVQLKVLYCGVCHADLHQIKNEWGSTTYPIVPGHEIVGVVTEVGNKVEKFKVGDKVGVGAIIGSCRSCENCANDLEVYCDKLLVTYNDTETVTYGGYSDIMVADEHFVVHWPENLPMEAAPLLCAGITTYSPLRYFGLDKPGMHIGVVGLGGLGHMAVKFAKAFGTKVTVISTSVGKKQEAIERFGVDSFLISHDPEQMQTNGKLILVGAIEKPLELPVFPILTGGRKLVGASATGGMKETQEMVNFSAKHNITPDVEIVPMDYVNTALDRLVKNDVKYRFVIDVGKTLNAAT